MSVTGLIEKCSFLKPPYLILPWYLSDNKIRNWGKIVLTCVKVDGIAEHKTLSGQNSQNSRTGVYWPLGRMLDMPSMPNAQVARPNKHLVLTGYYSWCYLEIILFQLLLYHDAINIVSLLSWNWRPNQCRSQFFYPTCPFAVNIDTNYAMTRSVECTVRTNNDIQLWTNCFIWNRGPPPFKDKIPKYSRFCRFFSLQNKIITFKWSNWSDITSPLL